MYRFNVRCEVLDDHKNMVSSEEFGLSLPGGKDHENTINALAEGQEHAAGISRQCGHSAIWKAARTLQEAHAEDMKEKERKEREELAEVERERLKELARLREAAGEPPLDDPADEVPED